MAKNEKDDWLCGYACALANVIRVTNAPQIATLVLQGDGLTLEKLEKAGVETYDLAAIRKAVKP